MDKQNIISFILSNCKYCLDKEDAQNYLSEILDISKGQLFLLEEVSEQDFEKVKSIVERLNNGEPIAKILSRANFYGQNFYVNGNVLTPRQDSELIVYLADKILKEEKNGKQKIKVLDLCCGSGCLGITLKRLNKNIELSLVDVSEEALKVAKTNAKNMEIEAKIIKSDMFNCVEEKFDIIISNPPYIKTNDVEKLEKQVKDFDPLIALDGSADGLHFYREIAKNVNQYLNTDGILLCEFGFDEAKEVKKIFDKKFLNVKIYVDNGGNERVVICKGLINGGK